MFDVQNEVGTCETPNERVLRSRSVKTGPDYARQQPVPENLSDILHRADRLGFGVDEDRFGAVNSYNRGLARSKSGQKEAAVADYEKALSLDPRRADALNNLGNLLQELERHEEALAVLDRAAALSPDNASLHANRAASLLRLERPEEALDACDRALALDPKEPVALYNKACALARMGNLDDAALCLDELPSSGLKTVA